MAQSVACKTGDQEVAGSIPAGERFRHHSFEGTGNEIFSTVIFSLLLIQEGQLSLVSFRQKNVHK